MLENIHVKNIALIKEIDINLFDGLNIVTGETGAGKSLIIGSIAIGLGAKVPKNYLKENTEEALVELTFKNISTEIVSLLNKYNIELEEGRLILQRKYINGRWVNRINFNTVSIGVLREIGSELMLIHGQHDNQILLDKKYHIKLLDKFAGSDIEELKKEYEKYYKDLLVVREKIKKIKENDGNKEKDIDYFDFVLKEIDAINPVIGEDDKLREEYKELVAAKNSVEYVSNIAGILDYITTNSVPELMDNAKKIEEIYPNIYKQLEDIDVLFDGLTSDIDYIKDDCLYDEDKFKTLDNRVDELDMLKRKYGATLEDVIAYRDEIAKKLDELNNAEDILKNLESERAIIEKNIVKLATKLSDIRKNQAVKMQKEIIQILSGLNFLQVDFEVRVSKGKTYTINGIDEVEFYISTNVGMEARPLIEVSSGGELSRIMLAIQSVISDLYEVGGIIFDEVDTGISGKTASMVAKLLKKMAKDKQIICITHLAQIAAARDVHIKIEKNADDGITETILARLDDEKSELEIARLLGGMEVTQATIDNAKELIKTINNTDI